MQSSALNQVQCPWCEWVQAPRIGATAFGYNAHVIRCHERRCKRDFVVVLFVQRPPVAAVHLIRTLRLEHRAPRVFDAAIARVSDMTQDDRTALGALYRLSQERWRDENPTAA